MSERSGIPVGSSWPPPDLLSPQDYVFGLESEIARLRARLAQAEAVARAAERWVKRKGHGADGHQCDLCDALAAYRERA